MKSNLIACLLTFVSPVLAHANQAINEYLLAAQNAVNGSESHAAGYKMNSVGGWLDNAQFRFNAEEQNDFNAEQRELSYEIRVKPKAWGQRKLEQDILKLQLNQQNKRYHSELNFALTQRYLALLKYIQLYQTTQYLYKLSAILKQEIGLLRSLVTTREFDAEKLLHTETMFSEANGLAELNLSRLNAMQSNMSFPMDNKDSLLHLDALSWLITIPELTRHMETQQELAETALPIDKQRLKLDLAKAENELKQTERQLGIDLLSFTYKDRRNDEMAFMLGVNIPLGTRFNAAEGQYKIRAEQNKLEHSIVVMQQSLQDSKQEVSWLVAETQLIKLQMQRTLQRLQQDNIKRTPLLFTRLRKQYIEQQKKMSTVNLKILSLYINYLSPGGQLIQQPLRNWVHKGIPRLDFKGS